MDKQYIKTDKGYLTVMGWDFGWVPYKSSALPFPNKLGITLARAKRYVKQNCERVKQ